MCEWGTDVVVNVKIPAHLSHTREAYWKETGIDACIAPLVKALQEAGIDMESSCCGHGKADGQIVLADGRVLVIPTVREQAHSAPHAREPAVCSGCGVAELSIHRPLCSSVLPDYSAQMHCESCLRPTSGLIGVSKKTSGMNWVCAACHHWRFGSNGSEAPLFTLAEVAARAL